MLLQERVLTKGIDRWLKLRWDGFVVHYHEIGLKGGNRRPFIKTLHQNLERVLKRFGAKVRDLFDRLIVIVTDEHFEEAMAASTKVFGVAYSAPVRILPRSVGAMVEAALQTYNSLALGEETFAIRVRRVDKSFPLTSRDLERIVGQQVAIIAKAPVDLENPQILLSFRVYEDCVYLVGPKIQGVGGLPIGVTGKVLALISGGIDSPVAAWLTMRRGCIVDFIHFHAFPNSEEAASEKIPKLVQMLVEPQGVSVRFLPSISISFADEQSSAPVGVGAFQALHA